MKIKIRKEHGISHVYLDDKELINCMGYEILSRGGDGFVTVKLTILADTLDMESDAKQFPQQRYADKKGGEQDGMADYDDS